MLPKKSREGVLELYGWLEVYLTMFNSLSPLSLFIPVVNIYDSCMIFRVRKLPNERINDTSEAFNVFSTREIYFFLRKNFLCSSILIIFEIIHLSYPAILFHSLGFWWLPLWIFTIDNNLHRHVFNGRKFISECVLIKSLKNNFVYLWKLFSASSVLLVFSSSRLCIDLFFQWILKIIQWLQVSLDENQVESFVR